MVIRERVIEARIATMIAKNPALAKGFGIELIKEPENLSFADLDNIIYDNSKFTSTEAENDHLLKSI